MEISNLSLVSYAFVCIWLICCCQVADLTTTDRESIPLKHSVVKSWADKLGVELWHLGDFITRRKEVQESFKSAQVVPRMGPKIIEKMAQEIKAMLDTKVSAVKRIMDAAENTALSQQNDPVNLTFQYFNAKDMLEVGEKELPNITTRSLDDRSIRPEYIPTSFITLEHSAHFFNTKVNTSISSVHIPTNVFDRAEDNLKAIQWSEKLDSIFLNNYQKDPTLSWQFFGSSTGFMRQFPASKWKIDPVDLFDCRLRSWYIEAASSPKDMVILVDVSGSMTGQRKDIARHVVNNILDTLSTNDYVNVYKFGEHVDAAVKCFNETLVQATMANIRILKMGMEEIKTDKIANYSAALIKAFEILEQYRYSEYGARCNQAIMLVSDGVPYDFTSIFETYNSQNNTFKPVRIFTYLIGKEVADVKKIKDMACTNQGYYVHLSTMAEVREQVLHYIPVMARPLVLGRDDHPVTWTQVYADVVDPQMTDWQWEVKECQEQKELFKQQRANKANFNTMEERDRRFEENRKKNLKQEYGTGDYHLLTTVSMPVYDRRQNATYIANLLGVAGTDVPIRDIEKMMMPFMLGVNGYAFIVTNNGFILTHPDLRPVFQGILKPSYNSIDMVEVELLDDDSEPREFGKLLLDVREQIVNQTSGSKWMMVKYHYDNMTRVSRTKRQYYWTPIKNTPFTLVITYPEQYGLYRAQLRYEDEIHRTHVKGNDVLSFFTGNNWKIHPDWIYCKHNNKSFCDPETELKDFLKNIQSPGWKWKERNIPPPEHAFPNSSTGRSSSLFDKESYYCERSLLQELVFDARVTEWYSRNVNFNPKDEKGNELKTRFGITVAFLATHSGLTRWLDFHSTTNSTNNSFDKVWQDFSEKNNRAIDEVWYKRAVEQHFLEPQSFVFSVPFEVGDQNGTLVTASHAIFHTEDKKSAPVAVVGYQFQHDALYTLFKNITSSCGDSCRKTCFSDDPNFTPDVECFVLDNNGFVILARKRENTGKFFGEVYGFMMKRLILEEVYQEIKIVDYQAVCFEPNNDGSYGNILRTPIIHLIKLFNWFKKIAIWSMVQLFIRPINAYAYEDYVYDDSSTLEPLENKAEPSGDEKGRQMDSAAIINRTRLTPCDQIVSLYTLFPIKNSTVYQKPADKCERPFVVLPIPNSNLILLVFELNCPVDPYMKIVIEPSKITYNNDSLPCHRNTINLRRRRPTSCINRHVNESLVELCGRGYATTMSVVLIGFSIIVSRIL